MDNETKLNPVQKELVQELIRLGNRIDFLLRNGTFPHEKEYERKQELIKELGLDDN
jgi:hypothetical protein